MLVQLTARARASRFPGRRRTYRTRVAAFVLLGMAAAAAAAPGDPDATFADHGERVTPYFSVDGLDVDAAGRVFVAGERSVDGGSVNEVARYTSDGRPDPTFGRDGVAGLEEFSDVGVTADLAVTDGGLPLVALETVEQLGGRPFSVFAVLRLTETGTVDRSFGTNGVVRLFADFSERLSLRIFPQAHGGFRVAGFVCGPTSCVVRAETFAEKGGAAGGFASPPTLAAPLRGAVLDRAGGDLVTASISTVSRDGPLPLDLAHYDAVGRHDDAFATGDAVSGIDLSNRGECRLAGGPDGSLVVAGTDPAGDAVVARFAADGARDRSFGANGTARLRVAGAIEAVTLAVAVGPDRRILVAGGARLASKRAEWFIGALDADGTAARELGTDGVVVRPPALGREFVPLLRVLPDGRLVVAGYAGDTFVVARYEGFPRACGDADGNGSVTVSDGVQVLRAAAGLPSACLASFCDADGSGDLGVTDGVRVLQAAAALPSTLRCGAE